MKCHATYLFEIEFEFDDIIDAQRVANRIEFWSRVAKHGLVGESGVPDIKVEVNHATTYEEDENGNGY